MAKAKSERLYKDSPSVERDKETGEVGIKRPSEADAESLGLSGSPLPGEEGKMPIDVQHEKKQDMVERHAAELSDLRKRHEKEHKKLFGSDDEDENKKDKK